MIKFKASEAKKCLDSWKQSYLDVRKRIEQSGRDTRWEFDRKKLFERSDYLSQVCSDIYDVAQVGHLLYFVMYSALLMQLCRLLKSFTIYLDLN